MTTKRHVFFFALLVAIGMAAGLAFAQETGPEMQGPSPPPSASTAPSPPEPSGISRPAASAGRPGLAALPNGEAVPGKWLPPGAFFPDRGPSEAIFPPQSITIRFNHKFHVQQGANCKTCHPGALTSQSVQDHLTPPGTVCDTCHMSDHSDLAKVAPGDEDSGKCEFCHIGYKDGDGNTVAKMSILRPNMVFNHKKHADRNINCQKCHGDVQELEQATRDQMPRMRGCFGCHQRPDSASQGEAKSACDNCHIKSQAGEGGRLKTVFASGTMKPPRWLHNAAHQADFIERHKMVAANDSQFCSNCHKEDFCVGCHDGRVRPRSIHPNDYISMHAIEARQATQKCTSCHREQSFCLQCHQRLGITMSGPTAVRENGRFHPPKFLWSDAPRKPGHHSFEAMRNLNACVSCHIERDCVVCHGGQGIGGGFNPHRDFSDSRCQAEFRRNPRPCLVCHEPGDGNLVRCQ
jgi:hypothetical protein